MANIIKSVMFVKAFTDRNEGYIVAQVIEKNGNDIKPLYFNYHGQSVLKEQLLNLDVGQKVILTALAMSRNGNIRATSQTKIFSNNVDFMVDMDIVQNYLNPQTVRIPEVLKSPAKRRLSVQGTVSNVGDIEEGQNWVKRRLTLKHGGDEVNVKLWGDHARNPPHPSTSIMVKCAKVEVYKEEISLSTTDDTIIDIVEDLETVETVEVLTFDNEYIVSTNAMFKHGIANLAIEDLPGLRQLHLRNGVVYSVQSP